MVINAIIGIVAAAFLVLGSGAWGGKESAAEHRADIAEVTKKIDLMAAALTQRGDSSNAMLARVLDALCATESKVKQRVCK